ncbi:nitroreductase family protein [Feifania hominis]|uniref:Nitroreductase family protein n=1 Tax=Feifania hominis TaxID=2763660 RepID=A0A926DF21_9FIRM|nr:nitroreductase family protein [Feifania hominis]MBC8536619.1 nitroreductase family protein [Feifania hominis]
MSTFDLICARRTIRKFRQEPVPHDLLMRTIEAACMAPSAMNRQPLKYALIEEPELCKKVFSLIRFAGSLPAARPTQQEAPTAYIAVLADRNLDTPWLNADVGASVQNILLTALEQGVGGCQLGAIDYEALSALFGLPEHLKLNSIVALGYPAMTAQAVPFAGDTKYYYDEDGAFKVPKRTPQQVLISIK